MRPLVAVAVIAGCIGAYCAFYAWTQSADAARRDVIRAQAQAEARAASQAAKERAGDPSARDRERLAQLLDKRWPTPATVKIVEARRLWSEGDRALAFVAFDSQNQSGATVRTRALFCYRLKDGNLWTSPYVDRWLIPCSDPPRDRHIAWARRFGFPRIDGDPPEPPETLEQIQAEAAGPDRYVPPAAAP